MTLGQLIAFLENRDPDKIVPLGFNNPHSYRGYYDQLAFEPVSNVTIGEMLNCAKQSLGKTFEGYKGGDYIMYEYTDVWISRYGWNDGEKIGFVLMKYMVGELSKWQEFRVVDSSEILSEEWCE